MLQARRLVVRGRAGVVRGVEEFLPKESELGTTGSGRAWRAAELRLKSYEDLHKLWYVLLKEKNALLTERALARSQLNRWENPERLVKVKKSMARLKTVVAERSWAHKFQQLSAEEDRRMREAMGDDVKPEPALDAAASNTPSTEQQSSSFFGFGLFGGDSGQPKEK